MKLRTVISASVLVIAAVALLTAQAWFFYEGTAPAETGTGPAPAFSLFPSESEYRKMIKTVTFEGIELKEISVRPGSNFWQIAKENSINIDTLISANPFWSDLNARSRQTVIVPSQKGVLIFVRDFSEMDTICSLYNVEKKDIVVQDLPFMAKYYRTFQSSPAPVALFVHDAKPNPVMMKAALAKSFEARELFRSPLGGRFSSYFGKRMDPILHTGQFHNGLDIASSTGTPVGAAAGGIIEDAGWMGGFGKAVIINHQNGYRTLYGHLSEIDVRPGQKVKPGSFVGRVGSTGWSTGPHLHFTVWHNGQLVNPMQLLW